MTLRASIIVGVLLVIPRIVGSALTDSTVEAVSDIRAAEQRKIPLEIMLKASESYHGGDAVDVTIIITNLFNDPLIINRRMLVNHPRLKGEVSFRILGPDGRYKEI